MSVNLNVNSITPAPAAFMYNSAAVGSFFDDPANVQQAIECLRQDRYFDETNLVQFLKQHLPSVRMEDDPYTYLLGLIVNNDTSIEEREKAADLYIQQHPDYRFEKNYAFVTNPGILVADRLIQTKQWTCTNPGNDEFYDEQLAGIFAGTVTLDKFETLSQVEFLKLVEKLGSEEPLFKPDAKGITVLTRVDGGKGPEYKVNKWYGSPTLNRYSSADSIYLPERCAFQTQAMQAYIKDLHATSALTMATFEGVDASAKNTVAVLGPYGVGKTTFLDQKMNQPYAQFSVDKINEYLDHTKIARRQDYHFEAVVIKSELFKELGNLPAVLQEGALIDQWRFGGFLRNNAVRHKVVIELAAQDPKESIARSIAARGLQEGPSTTSSRDALKFRAGRIKTLQETDKVVYSLYCSRTVHDRPDFLLVAKIQNKQLTIVPGQERLYEQLTAEPTLS